VCDFILKLPTLHKSSLSANSFGEELGQEIDSPLVSTRVAILFYAIGDYVLNHCLC
jgi:hypothetical protein